MTGITDLCHPETVRVAAAHQAEAEKIAAELAAIASSGMVLPGSITSGAPAAAAATAAATPTRPACTARTGSGPARSPRRPSAAGSAPNSTATTRPGSTTTGGCTNCSPGLRPSAPPPSTLTPAGNARQADWPAEPEQKSPDNVGSARLTCGQPPSRRPSAQVSPKREDLTRFLQIRSSIQSLTVGCCPAWGAIVGAKLQAPIPPDAEDPADRRRGATGTDPAPGRGALDGGGVVAGARPGVHHDRGHAV